jgi:signal transduction histidine kinase
MSLKSLIKLPRTLATRLTLWYSGIFTLSYVAAFLIFVLLGSPLLQKDIDQDLLGEIRNFSSLIAVLATDGIEAEEIEPYLRIQAKNAGVDKRFYRLLSADGDVIASSDMMSWRTLDVNQQALRQLRKGKAHMFAVHTLPETAKKIRLAYGSIKPGLVLEVGQSLDEPERLMNISRDIFGISLLGLIVIAPLVGWFMARRALMGVAEVRETATEISNGALHQRVPLKKRGDEVESLALAFNQMVDRIQALINGMRDMTDNVAHDLRSPIARLRGLAEITLTTGKSLDEYKNMAVDTIEESDHLLEMLNTMLDISAVESGADHVDRQKINVADTVQYACDLFEPIARDKAITIRSYIPETCCVSGDPSKIQRMVANLLDNALKYSYPGGVVSVTVDEAQGEVTIAFHNTGIGISAADLPHIFQRFYRCDRSRTHTGAGLGLSLARAIARAHRGDITVASRPGSGSAFTIRLPAAPPISPASRAILPNRNLSVSQT